MAGCEALVALGEVHVRSSAAVVQRDLRIMDLRAVAHLDLELERLTTSRRRRARHPVDGIGAELVASLVGARVAACRVEHVGLEVLLNDVPRAEGAKGVAQSGAEAASLADGVEPQAPVRADLLARLKLEDGARSLAEMVAEEVVVVELPEEADTLRESPGSRWQSDGNQMAFPSGGNQMAFRWRSDGNHMAIIWRSDGNRMVII